MQPAYKSYSSGIPLESRLIGILMDKNKVPWNVYNPVGLKESAYYRLENDSGVLKPQVLYVASGNIAAEAVQMGGTYTPIEDVPGASWEIANEKDFLPIEAWGWQWSRCTDGTALEVGDWIFAAKGYYGGKVIEKDAEAKRLKIHWYKSLGTNEWDDFLWFNQFESEHGEHYWWADPVLN
jgi:hypothetical protein